MRDNFKNEVKRILATRVAYRCCFPNCNRLTVGPNLKEKGKISLLGEAAHIHAASSGGPRYFASMTTDQRADIENGIWLCTAHSTLIDTDHGTYSADTLRQWKAAAETETYRQLESLEKTEIKGPTTLICLDIELLFEATWKAITDDNWTFTVKKFIYGNEQKLSAFNLHGEGPMLKYIIVETQGDGRLIQKFKYGINRDNEPEIIVSLLPGTKPVPVQELIEDIIKDRHRQPVLENGTAQKISGPALARQVIELNLNMPLGGFPQNPLLGSLFSSYYQQLENDPDLLNRVIKMELIRLMAIPAYQVANFNQRPELDFIRRIFTVSVGREINGTVPVFISLEWGEGTAWSGTVHVDLHYNNDESAQYILPEFVRDLFDEKPLQKLRRQVAAVHGEEIKQKVNDELTYNFFTQTLDMIMARSVKALDEDIYTLFDEHQLTRFIKNNTYKFEEAVDPDKLFLQGTVEQLGISINLLGFVKDAFNSFNSRFTLYFFLYDYYYEIGASREDIWFKRLYHKPLLDKDIEAISNHWMNFIAKELSKKIDHFCN